MLEQTIIDLLVLSLIAGYFGLGVSISSLKYHAAKYQASPEAVHLYLSRLILPLRFFYSHNLRGIYYDDAQHSIEQIMRSLNRQRILASIIPFLFIVILIFNLIRVVLGLFEFDFMNIVYLVIFLTGLILAWRFGTGLKDIEMPLQESVIPDKSD